MTEDKQKILVIDDDAGIREAFLLALEDTAYEVKTCANGQQGIEAFDAGRFDLVYLDLKMPGMNGVAVLQEIRKRDPEVPVYIVTAYFGDFSEELEQFKQDKLNFEVLIKPIGQTQIIDITRSILEGSRIVE